MGIAAPMPAVKATQPSFRSKPENAVSIFGDGIDPFVEQAIFLRIGFKRFSVKVAHSFPRCDPNRLVRIKKDIIDPEISQAGAGRVDRPLPIIGGFPAAIRSESGPLSAVKSGKTAAMCPDPFIPIGVHGHLIDSV